MNHININEDKIIEELEDYEGETAAQILTNNAVTLKSNLIL